MRLLRVTAKLAAPVAVNNPLNLDGIVLYAALRENGNFDQSVSRGKSAPVIDFDAVPVAVSDFEPRVFMSSDLQHAGEGRKGKFVRKRDGVDFHHMKRKVHTGGGPWKDMMKSISMVVAECVWWHCVGDRRVIQSLLDKHITHVGALRAQGYGRVREWGISAEAGDSSLAVCRDGRLLRTVPASACDCDSVPVLLPVRPPYWHRDSQVLAYPAGTRTRGFF